MYKIDIVNANAQNDHWLGNPANTITTGELDFSHEFDQDYLKHLIRMDNMVPFYQSNPWYKKVRPMVLQRDRYECQRCRKNHKLTVYDPHDPKRMFYVHHICELKKYPYLCLNLNILVTLCWQCHEEVHGHIQLLEPDPFTNFDASEFIL